MLNEITRLWLWNRWLRWVWQRHYARRWIVPVWPLVLFIWRLVCEKKPILWWTWRGCRLQGGWLSLEMVYQCGEKRLRLENVCWVTWRPNREYEKTFDEFVRYLFFQKKQGVDYVVGVAHERYTSRYWRFFLERSRFAFDVVMRYQLLFASLEETYSGMVPLRGEVERYRGDFREIREFFTEGEHYSLVLSHEQLKHELRFGKWSETWVYRLRGRIYGWLNFWVYFYIEKGKRKRGAYIRWMDVKGLSYEERKGFLLKACQYLSKRCQSVVMPDFLVQERMWLEELGFYPSHESYVVYGVDLQGEGRLDMRNLKYFFVF